MSPPCENRPERSKPKSKHALKTTPVQIQEAQLIKEEKAAAKREEKRVKEERGAARKEKLRVEEERLRKMQEEAEAWRRRDQDVEWRRKEWVRMGVERDEREKMSAGKWQVAAKEFSDDETGKVPFPIPKLGTQACKRDGCVMGEKLGVCHHDVERVLMEGNGVYDVVYLKKERLKWHPDRFPGRGDVQIMAQEMFQIIQRLIDGPGSPGMA